MKLGELYISEFSGDDIQPEILAEELGISDFRFPDEYYQRAEVVTQELVEKIIPHLKGLTQEEIGDYLLAHREELFAIFDRFPDMYRFPILVTKENLISHGILSAQLIGMDPTEFYGAFLKCMHFYLYLRSIRGLSKLYQRNPKIPPVLPIVYNVVQQECLNELECAWGSRSHYFFSKMLPGEKGIAITKEMLQGNPFVIPPNCRAQYKNKKVEFWRQEGLPPERILLNIGQHIEDKISPKDREKFAQLDSEALDFFLCQNHILGYEEIIGKIFKNTDHIAAWEVWIARNIHLLKKSDSQTMKVFRGVFGLKDSDIFGKDIGQLTREAKQKIPKPLQDALIKSNQELRARIKTAKKLEKPAKTVGQLPNPPVGFTAMASLVTRPIAPPREIIASPILSHIFVDLDEAKKNKKQLTKIDFSGYRFPTGTKIIFERSLPGRKKNFQTIELAKPTGTNEITPVLGKSIEGHFYYRITIALPQSHKFDGENVFEASIYYAKTEPTEEEKAEERALQAMSQPRDVPTLVAPVMEKVARGVDDTLASDVFPKKLVSHNRVLTFQDTIDAWELALEIPGESLNVTMDDAGNISLTLTDPICLESLHDSTLSTFVVTPDNRVPGGFESIASGIISFVNLFRIKEIERKEQEKVERQEWTDYIKSSQELRPYLELLQELTGTEGLTEDTFGGSLNRAFSKRGVLLRVDVEHSEKSVKNSRNVFILKFSERDVIATYMPTVGLTFSGVGYESSSSGKKRAYGDFREVLETLGDFLFLNKEKKAIRLRKMKEHRQRIISSFIKNLECGRGEMIVLRDSQIVPSFLGNRRAHALFPSESCPLPRYVSPIVKANLRQQYDDVRKELGEGNKDLSVVCLVKKGYIQMGGDAAIQDELTEDTPEEEIGEEQGKETTVERNINSLFRSPQGRDLLWDRIYGTRGGGSGTPIYNGSLQVLDDVLEKKYGKTLPTNENEKQKFIDDYLEALKEANILISYVRFIAVTMSEVEKALTKTTAG